MTTCILCETEATATARGFPVCAGHHEDYIRENEHFTTWTEIILSESGESRPVTRGILMIALEEQDRRLEQAIQAIREEMADIDIYVTRQENRYELWLRDNWRELTEADLATFFTPDHAAQIITHKGQLGGNCAAYFKHPYTPDMDYEDLKPAQFRYIGLTEV